jgi:hypothetical protein
MSSRVLALGAGVLLTFTIVAAILLRLMPGPLKATDYLVVGAVSTMVAMLVLFIALITTTLKAPNPFFRTKRKIEPASPEAEPPEVI